MSTSYYDNNSAAFFAGSVAADMSADRARFLAHVKPGGTILDAGCGSGRDALAFMRAGYAVSAFDGSAEMAKLAAAHTGIAVQHLRFNQIEWKNTFDGIWACASLLHVARADLPDAVSRLARALNPAGVLYVSFKYGSEERDTKYRRFTDMNETLLTNEISRAGLMLLDIWASQDVRTERATEAWISAIARR